MKLIIKSKGGGKTTELIEMAHKTHQYIVVADAREAGRVFHEAQKNGKTIQFPITYDEFLMPKTKRKPANFKQGVLIDNAEYLLSYITHLYGEDLKAITLTREGSPQ